MYWSYVLLLQTDVDLKKGKRVLDMKQKNNFLATANVRETEYMAKKTRLMHEPSEQRYDNHLSDIQTPSKDTGSNMIAQVEESEATSSGMKTAISGETTHEDINPTDNQLAVVGRKRKAFLGLF